METGTFAAGCFLGVEAAFRQVPGVKNTAVGYLGGNVDQPTYKQVCTGTTNHAEVVQVEFDPSQVTYSQLLQLFWQIHDPTTKNRQGPDRGTQYRSGIFFHSPAQEEAAKASLAIAQKSWPNPIVTEITPAPTFWLAEDYHQHYL